MRLSSACPALAHRKRGAVFDSASFIVTGAGQWSIDAGFDTDKRRRRWMKRSSRAMETHRLVLLEDLHYFGFFLWGALVGLWMRRAGSQLRWISRIAALRDHWDGQGGVRHSVRQGRFSTFAACWRKRRTSASYRVECMIAAPGSAGDLLDADHLRERGRRRAEAADPIKRGLGPAGFPHGGWRM